MWAYQVRLDANADVHVRQSKRTGEPRLVHLRLLPQMTDLVHASPLRFP